MHGAYHRDAATHKESHIMSTKTTYHIDRDILRETAAHAERMYPEECCGALIADGTGQVLRAVALENLAATSRPKDPSGRARGARDAYEIDPVALDQLHDEAERTGERVVGIYHSHVEVGAYFSEMDRAVALAFGDEPSYPLYLVVSVKSQRCDGFASYTWQESDFLEAHIAWP
jgi:proteasome lid subunit RPN8/RPN11